MVCSEENIPRISIVSVPSFISNVLKYSIQVENLEAGLAENPQAHFLLVRNNIRIYSLSSTALVFRPGTWCILLILISNIHSVPRRFNIVLVYMGCVQSCDCVLL